MHQKSLTELRAALDAKTISAVELAQLYLQRIDAAKNLNAFISVDHELTLEQAKAADALHRQGRSRRADRPADRAQRRVRHARLDLHGRLENARELREPVRRHRRRAPARTPAW